MGSETEIAWCDSTFNPWIGCQKVLVGCDHCYAETLMDKRYGRVKWGPHGDRVRTSEANWKLPRRWNRNAAAFQAEHGHRQRVFCSSLADVFDNQVPEEWRTDLYNLIVGTPDLDWLLLTKRPENIARMMAGIPPNVWLGTTCEDQAAYDRRWPILLSISAKVRFISYEPAIGPLDIEAFREKPDWLICGGESGAGYRDMPEDWADTVRFDCGLSGTAFFMKQMAGKKPIPYRLMVREFPVSSHA